MIIRNCNYCKYHNCYCCCYCYRKRSMNFKKEIYRTATRARTGAFSLYYATWCLYTDQKHRTLICRIVFSANLVFYAKYNYAIIVIPGFSSQQSI